MKVAARTQASWGSKFQKDFTPPPVGQTEARLPDLAGFSHFSASLSSPSFSWAHTVPAGLTDSVVIVIIGHSGTGPNSHFPTSVTLDGTEMTAIPGAVVATDGSNNVPRFQRWYYALSPTSGSKTVAVTMNSSTSVNVVCSAANWQYVKQTGTFGTPAVAQSNTGTSISAAPSGTTPTDRLIACAVVRSSYPDLDGTLTYHDNWSSSTSTYLTLASKSGGGVETCSFAWSATSPPNSNTLIVVPIHGNSYAVTTPPPAGDDFGTSIAAAEGGGTFTRQFFEDFPVDVPEGGFLNNPAYSNKWDAYATSYYMTNANPANGGNGDHYGGNGNLSVVNGELIMRCYRDSATGKAVGCAPEPKVNGSKYQTYGRYAFSFRVLENTAGWKIAWLLWNLLADQGTKPWPAAGEFDMAEGSVNSNIGAFHHLYNATAGSQQDAWGSSIPFSTGYHTLVAEWTPNYVRVVVDGVELGRRNASTANGGTSRIVSDPMRCVLQTEVNLGGTQPSTPGTMRIAVDKVAVYSYAA